MTDSLTLLPDTPPTVSRPKSEQLPRYRRAATQVPRMVVTTRDEALLLDLWRLGLATTSQLELLRNADPDPALRFPSRFTLTQRLKLLFHHRYASRIARPLAAGSLEPVYVLDSEGARLLSLQHGEVKAKSPSRLPKAAALDHLLQIVQVRVSLQVAGVRSGVQTLPEGQEADGKALCLKRWWSGEEKRFRTLVETTRRGALTQERVSLIPDAAFLWRVGERTTPCFLEVDRATESVGVLSHKMRAYAAFLGSGDFADHLGVPAQTPFRVLFVVPTLRRAEATLGAVTQRCRKQPTLAPLAPMFRVALAQDVTPERIAEAVWWQGGASPSDTPISAGEQGLFWLRLKTT